MVHARAESLGMELHGLCVTLWLEWASRPVGRRCAHNPNFVWGAVLITVRDYQLYVCRKSRRGRAEIRHFLGVASIFRAEAPVKPAAAAHARRQRVVQQLSGAPHSFRRTFARQPSKLRHRGEHDKDHGGPPWGQGSPRIYITTADAAVRLQEQPALEPPARCRADNPRRPAGSGRSCRLPRGPS